MHLTKTQQNYISIWAKRIRIINTLGGECEICKSKDLFSFHVHHRDPKQKQFNINSMRNGNWDVIEKEIAKCQLVCGNCHSELHYVNGKSSKIKEIVLNDFLKKISCEKCLYSGENKKSLVFHHNGVKNFNVADFFARKCVGLNIWDLFEEIKKCQILCVNCHMKIHIDVDKFNHFLPEIMKKVENPRHRSILNYEQIKKLMLENKGVCEIAKIIGTHKSSIFYVMEKIKADLQKEGWKYSSRDVKGSGRVTKIIESKNETKNYVKASN